MRSLGRKLASTLCLALGLAAVGSAQTQVFTYTGGLQSLTVPPGILQAYILAEGAKGGNAQGAGAIGGAGGRIEGLFNVTPGAVLQVLVGGRGTNTTDNNGGGGGGASSVTVGSGYPDFATPLIVAGGGGGGSRPISAGIGPGGVGGAVLQGTGLGGSGGGGAGGGGIIGNGQPSFFGGGAGAAAINGAAGGGAHSFATGGAGGFGGGAGAGGREGAGGGGYTGGRGAPSSGNAHGGTSFANCTAVTTNTPGGAAGPDGMVIISFIATAAYAFTGSLQTYLVPLGVHEVTITAAGGKGGNAQGAGATGGFGGTIQGTFPVVPGSVLQIIVGRRGGNTTNNNGGGGGGASAVTVGSDYPDFATPLIVAGGGGGGSRPISAGIGPGGPGGANLGGTGLGGSGGAGAGGGGIIGSGQVSFFGGGAGAAAINGAAGGAAHSFAAGGGGGYGGGAGAGGREGAGGGGYSGGSGAPSSGNALGGTSFAALSATNVVDTPGGNSNTDGAVTIVPVIPSASGVLSLLTDVAASMAAPYNLTAVTPKAVAAGQVLRWVVDHGTSPCAAAPLLLFANVGGEATSEAVTPGVPGFHRFHNLSVPTGTALILGDGIGVGPLVGLVVGPLGPNLVGDPPAGLALPSGLPPGLEIRFQAVSLCACSYGFAVSNECSFITQ